MRVAFQEGWELDLRRLLQGTVIFLRRPNDQGEADLLGQQFLVDPPWLNRLVRAEVDLTKHQMRFYGSVVANPTSNT
jgi:hypothetical protein